MGDWVPTEQAVGVAVQVVLVEMVFSLQWLLREVAVLELHHLSQVLLLLMLVVAAAVSVERELLVSEVLE
jgi:hypothetical protein